MYYSQGTRIKDIIVVYEMVKLHWTVKHGLQDNLVLAGKWIRYPKGPFSISSFYSVYKDLLGRE